MMFELRVTSCELRVRGGSRDATHRRGRPSVRRRLGSKLETRNSQLAPRGLTLIELLITISILTTLAAMFLGASNAAMESARSARTKTTINKIHTLLMERWGSYTTRRVDVDTTAMTAPPPTGQQMAGIRLSALRLLMQLEIPDRWSDIIGGPVVDNMPVTITSAPTDRTLSGYAASIVYPSLAKSYLRRYSALNPSASSATIEDNQGAECLYMIIMLATGDGEARTLFSRQDIGDTDGDGALEFLDGWGRPIHFLRWPAGFVNDSDLMSGDASADHDPFDFFRRDVEPDSPVDSPPWLRDANPAFRLVPLVYSGGPDGDPDLFTAKQMLIDDPFRSYDTGDIDARIGTPMSFPTVDPEDDGDNWHDNIHNHLLDNR